ncbi:hypothetical protein BD769DRAFT_1674696 [Suillus cothurnatus]|nr:hypothetical protein BD769DRAFT_1674696 [Suillus cothurnatus]
MPVSTRSMTINATMERERMRREIREANATKATNRRGRKRYARCISKVSLPVAAIARGTRSGAYKNCPEERSDDGVLSSTMEQEELLDSDSKTEVSLMVKTENDEFEMTMDIEMDSRNMKQENLSSDTIIKQEVYCDEDVSTCMAGEMDGNEIKDHRQSHPPSIKEEPKENERLDMFDLMELLSRR